MKDISRVALTIAIFVHTDNYGGGWLVDAFWHAPVTAFVRPSERVVTVRLRPADFGGMTTRLYPLKEFRTVVRLLRGCGQ